MRSFNLLFALLVIGMQSVLAQAGRPDLTFNPTDAGNGAGDMFNQIVYSTYVQSDNKVLVGGQFSTYNGQAAMRLLRLNSDGTRDETFNSGGSGLIGTVYCITQLSTGKYLVAGTITSYNGTARNSIIRLNADGTLDVAFDAGVGANNSVKAILVQSDGKIVVAGDFTAWNGTATGYIKRLTADGAADATFGSGTGANSVIKTMAQQADGKILLGGSFTNFNGNSKSYFCRLTAAGAFDGTLNSGTGPGLFVNHLLVRSDGKIWVAGNFSTYNGSTRIRIARVNSDGSLDATFTQATGVDRQIYSVVQQADGKLIIGGAFLNHNTTTRQFIARLNTDGALDATYVPPTGTGGDVNTVALQGTSIIAGGSFSTFGGRKRGFLTRLTSTAAVDMTFNTPSGADDLVQSVVALASGKYLVGGSLTSYNGIPATGIACLKSDGTIESAFASGTGTVGAITQFLQQPDGKVLICGSIQQYNGSTANSVARINTDGTIDNTFSSGSGNVASVTYRMLLQPDGKVIIGGTFTTFAGQSRAYIARLTSTGSVDLSFNATGVITGQVRALALQPDGKILVGGTTGSTSNTTKTAYIKRLNADGTLDATFTAGVPIYFSGTSGSCTVSAIGLQSSGRVYIGGDFTFYNGTNNPCTGLAVLNADGSFYQGGFTGATVSSIAVQPNGRAIIAGTFTLVDNVARNGIARVLADGSLDASFDPGSGAQGIFAVALQADGKAIIGGNFTSYNGTGRNRVARLQEYLATPGSISPASYCAGAAIAVPFTVNQSFTAGNVFTLQLSDPTGSFSNPTEIGSLPGTAAGTINGTIPVTAASGNGYKVRVVSSGPLSVGEGSSALQVTGRPDAGTIVYAKAAYCASDDAALPALSGQAGGMFSASPAGLSLDANTGQVVPASSVPGTYQLTYTMAANGCFAAVSTNTSLTVNAAPSATITYPTSPFCVSTGSGSVSLSGTQGGVFSATPAGLSINAISGDFSPSSSTPGTYTVTYSIAASGGCSAYSRTASVTISAAADASISYPGSPYCVSTGTVDATLTGTMGGSFQSTSGLSIDAVSGSINTIASTPGSYTVTYAVAAGGNCPSFSTQAAVVISSAASASISYSANSFCQNSGEQGATRVGTAGGTFSAAPSGLAINSGSGAINTNLSQPGVYTITYSVAAANGCSSFSSSTQVTIIQAFAATIAYPGSPYCLATGTAPVFLSGTNGGSFSAIPAGLSIDPVSGAIDLAASASGIYTVTYGTSSGCGAAGNTQVAIRPGSALLSAPNQVYCSGMLTTPPPFAVVPGFTYSWTNSNPGIGLATSGLGDLPPFVTQNQSATAAYAVIAVYGSGGSGCSFKQQSFRITVQPQPSVSNAPADAALCAGTQVGDQTFTGPVAGTLYTWTNSNPAIGAGAGGSNSIGAFTAQNNTGAAAQATISVTPFANGCAGGTITYTYTVSPSAGSISYPQSTYCQYAWAYVRRSGSAGGVYTASPAGLALNAVDGSINLGASVPGTYHVFYTVSATGGCSASASTVLTINPQATVNPIGNQVFCSGIPTPAIPFAGTATSFSWTNDNASIGLAAAGTGTSLPSFTTVNPGPGPRYAYIKVTPLGNGSSTCPGKLIAFRITVNPCGTITQSGNTGGGAQTLRTALTLSPNPVSGDVLRVGYNGSAKRLTVEVRNANGTTLLKGLQLKGASASVFVGLLHPGTYHLVVGDEESGVQTTLPFVKL
ncbi:delta-60 repeat domain-containing protein [Flaviaesturariibacter aridisoli]|uniref:T9SS type A sorting domain-containing protein n=1 Tax=Flaviaesturariibacter aridisoli TaxID=2545761 RepID=A0A4R4DTQ1_9BACT|nr:delta-60 repeat domain-containing protein [Flaviaesturariibacter aridisoli]TCZ63463.1 hypothetical protein E0486_18520 [Flaviaesturariibacter aridisoli]